MDIPSDRCRECLPHQCLRSPRQDKLFALRVSQGCFKHCTLSYGLIFSAQKIVIFHPLSEESCRATTTCGDNGCERRTTVMRMQLEEMPRGKPLKLSRAQNVFRILAQVFLALVDGRLRSHAFLTAIADLSSFVITPSTRLLAGGSERQRRRPFGT